MRNKVHYINGVRIWHRVLNLEDLLNEKRHRPKKFRKIKDLLGIKTDREAKKKAKEVINDFLSMVSDDMIERKDIFIFPLQNFGFLKIGDKTNFYHHGDKPIIDFFESKGTRFGPMLVLDKNVSFINKKFYHVRFTRPNRMRLREKIKSGERYG